MGSLGCLDCSSFQVSGELGAIPEDTRRWQALEGKGYYYYLLFEIYKHGNTYTAIITV